MRIGIDISTSKSPDAATFAEVVASLGYDYTWAYDASKQTSLVGIDGASDFGATLVADGINLDFTGNKAGTQFKFEEGDFTAGSVSSSGSGTQIIPDGAFPYKGNAVGHPGRYLSTVVTLNSLTIADGSIGGSDNATLFGWAVHYEGGALSFLAQGFDNPSDAVYVNGTARSGAFSQSEIDGLIGSPIAITFDMDQATSFGGSTPTDADYLISYPAFGEDVTMDATLHGFIFSATPPNVTKLPVEISNPTVSGE